MAASPDGKVFAASMPFKPGSFDLSDRKHFKDAVRTLDFSAGEYIRGRIGNLLLLNFSLPVLDAHKKLIAVVSVGFDLRQYTRFVSKANLPEGYVVTIVDHRGVHLFRLPETDSTPPGMPLSDSTFERVSGGQNHGFYETTGGMASIGCTRSSNYGCAMTHLPISSSLPAWVKKGFSKKQTFGWDGTS